MATTELQPGKLFYTISEVADILGEKVSLVRFWSDNFPKYVKPKRTQNKNNRIYDEAAIRNLQLIHYLVKEKGLTLDGTLKQLSADRRSVEARVKALESLKLIREQRVEIKNTL